MARPSTHSQADVDYLQDQAQYTDLLLCRRYRNLYSGQAPWPKRATHPRSTGLSCEMSNASTRAGHIEAIMDCVINSIRQGDNAYVHCISGLSRAPVAAAIFSAKLMGISLEDAKWWINQARNVKDERNKSRRGNREDMDGPWITRVLMKNTTAALIPTCFSCRVHLGQSTVHASTISNDALVPICRSSKGAGKGMDWRDPLAGIQTVGGIEQAAHQFGSTFCADCEPLLRASLRVQARQLWQD